MIKISDKPLKTAFTENAKGRPHAIISNVGITKFMPPEQVEEKNIVTKKALWDTGATACAVTKKTALELGLIPVRPVKVKYGKGVQWSNAYLVNIFLPGRIFVPAAVTECDDSDDFDLIIGMDVINQGDFAVTHKNGKSKFSFRIPAEGDIDFTKEINELHEVKRDAPTSKKNVIMTPMRFGKVNGNLSCPCGSGKKWKQCHGKPKSPFHK